MLQGLFWGHIVVQVFLPSDDVGGNLSNNKSQYLGKIVLKITALCSEVITNHTTFGQRSQLII